MILASKFNPVSLWTFSFTGRPYALMPLALIMHTLDGSKNFPTHEESPLARTLHSGRIIIMWNEAGDRSCIPNMTTQLILYELVQFCPFLSYQP